MKIIVVIHSSYQLKCCVSKEDAFLAMLTSLNKGIKFLMHTQGIVARNHVTQLVMKAIIFNEVRRSMVEMDHLHGNLIVSALLSSLLVRVVTR